MRTFLVLTIAALLMKNPDIFSLNELQLGIFTTLTVVGGSMAFVEDISKIRD